MISRKLFDAQCRIEAMWPLPNGDMPGSMLEAFEDGARHAVKLAPYTVGWNEDEIDELFAGEGDASTAWEELSCNLFNEGKQLFVVLAANPVFQPSKDGGCHFSWGHYRTEVFIAETVEAAMEEAAAWADSNFKQASRGLAA